MQFSTGDSLSFDGNGDYVTASHTPLVNDFTFCMWIKPVELGQRDEWAAASAPNGAETAGWYWHNNWDTNDYNYLGLELSSGSWSQCQGIAIASITLNEWHHVAFTKSSETGVRLYYDGGLVGDCPGYTGNVIDEGNTLYIGRGYPCPYGDLRFFHGTIDEVRIYNRALALDEIKCHYERRKYADPEPGVTGVEEEEPSQQPIPEFSSIAIPVAAILGLLFLFNYRKQRRN